jgi:hypothetical protein
MPARAEKLYLFMADTADPDRVMDFPLWWDRRGFFAKYGDREIDLGNPIYVDYALLLTVYEARAFDKQCREAFSTDPASTRQHMVSAMGRLEAALEKATWVVVESYEWESGMD